MKRAPDCAEDLLKYV